LKEELMKSELVIDAGTALGEGAFWDDQGAVLYWVDIEESEVRMYDPDADSDQVHKVNDRPGTIVPRVRGGIVVAMGHEIVTFDEPGGEARVLCRFAEEPDENRMNDGKCDPAGRLWVGSLSTKGTRETSALYCVEADGTYRAALTGVTISNGIVWTPDEKTMYYIDTGTRAVQAFDYDKKAGAIGNGRTAFEIPEAMGYPDGMTIDSQGMLWIAMFFGKAVRRFDPQRGVLLESVELPVSNATSCALGGADLRDLYITTARAGLTNEALAAEPAAGGLFRARVEAPGIPQHRFAG
jgi:sugar lactone lactonase YvrE